MYKTISRTLTTAGILACSFIFISSGAAAQNKADVTAKVMDSEKKALPYATVTLQKASDSVMVDYAVTNNSGEFTIKNVPQGEYFMNVSMYGYSPGIMPVSITDTTTVVDLGELTLYDNAEMLGDVVVTGDLVPVQFKGDTVEYNAAAFKTQENAPLEDLIKQLPGVEVDEAGNIKANGEDVTKILVDGKEFFGDDPKVATKNLPADAVDKVQVYDKQSDNAEFTGVDDGEDTKAINIKLKEDKKQGWFGNVMAGAGANNDFREVRYKGKLNANRFNKKMQLSMIGMGNNVNEAGFSFEEYFNFAGTRGMNRGGGFGWDAGNFALPINFGNNEGLINTYAGGINFNYDFSKKTRLESSYFFNHQSTNKIAEIERDYFGETTNFDALQNTVSESLNQSHELAFKLEHDIDTTQEIQWEGTGGFNFGRGNTLDSLRNLSNSGSLLSSSFSDNTSNWYGIDAQTEFSYRKKWKNGLRNFTIDGNYYYTNSLVDNRLVATNSFGAEDSLIPTITARLDQKQRTVGESHEVGTEAEVNFAMNKSGTWWGSVEAGMDGNFELSDKDFVDVALDGSESQNDALSNYYYRTYIDPKVQAKATWNKDKMHLSMRVEGSYGMLMGELRDGTSIDRNFPFLLPRLNFRYKINKTTRFSVRYSTRTGIPSLNQLQPIVDNSNPLRVYVGNPNLSASYSHQGNLHFMHYSQFSQINVFGTVYGGYTQNPIVNSISYDSSFVQTVTPVNANSSDYLGAYAAASFPLKFMKSKISFSANYMLNHSDTYVNAIENRLSGSTTEGEVSITNTKKDIIDFTVGATINYNTANYSVSNELNNDYYTTNYYARFEITLWKMWGIGSQFDYTTYTGSNFGDPQVVPLWKAETKLYLLKRRLTIAAEAYDLLNRNRGVFRSTEINYVEDKRVNNIGRFFMLSATWKLNKFDSEDKKTEVRFRPH